MDNVTEIDLWTAVQIMRISPREVPVFFHSDTGIGKTGVVGKAAELDHFKYKPMIAQIMAPQDAQGLPVIHREEGKPAYVEYIKPELLPTEALDGPDGIWFVDELPNAPRAVQAALQTIFTQGNLNEYVFPSSWKQIAAGNRLEDHANTFELPRPVANRFMHLYIRTDHKVFLEWGAQASEGSTLDSYMFGKAGIRPFPKVADIMKGKPRIHPLVRAFIGMRPEMLAHWNEGDEAFASPRTWEMTSWVLYTEPPTELRIPMIFGLVGTAAGSQFEAYLADASILPNMRELLDGSVKLRRASGATRTNFLEGNGFSKTPISASQQYAIAVGIAAEVDTSDPKDVGRFFDVIEKLAGKDSQIVAVAEIALRDPQVSAQKRFAQYGKEVMPRLTRQSLE